MKILRTPDERFAGLPGYAFRANYAEVADAEGGRLRVHYLDEGPLEEEPLGERPQSGEVVVLLHGEPSWSYLYRSMIPVLTAAGHRCIAPDLVGFGRSDKPTERSDYTYARHVEWLRALLFDELDLEQITLVCQDWGGLIGLRLVGQHPERFARVVAANTFLPTGEGEPSAAFLGWRKFSQEVDPFPVGAILNGATKTGLAAAVMAAYDAPFPDESYKAGARKFPLLVPISADDPGAVANREAWKGLAAFDKPFLTAFSDGDPVTAGQDVVLQQRVAGAVGQPHTTILGGGHFLQEDRGPELAKVVVDFITANPR